LRSLSRRGAKVLATTHYGELKQFALSAGRFENASVEFDPVSLRPTYHLRIGVPGASNALDIAARLGMPPDLVQRARRYLGRERGEVEAATQQLDATQRQLSQQTEETRQKREEVEALKREYEARIQRVERESQRELERARREAKQLVENATKEADAALRELRKAARGTGAGENKDTENARGRLRTLRERVGAEERKGRGASNPEVQEQGTRGEGASKTPSSSTPATHGTDTPKVGQIVRLKTLDREGEVLKIENNRVEVRVGAMKIEVKIADLELVERADAIRGVGAIQARKAWSVAPEINLIGQDTVSALDELEKYLDDAVLAEKKEVRIVHGRGSGALRTAVHRFLKSNRTVEDYELAPQNEGGEGATVVKLG
jgi:DNA mismatch repair protein MutS2